MKSISAPVLSLSNEIAVIKNRLRAINKNLIFEKYEKIRNQLKQDFVNLKFIALAKEEKILHLKSQEFESMISSSKTPSFGQDQDSLENCKLKIYYYQLLENLWIQYGDNQINFETDQNYLTQDSKAAIKERIHFYEQQIKNLLDPKEISLQALLAFEKDNFNSSLKVIKTENSDFKEILEGKFRHNGGQRSKHTKLTQDTLASLVEKFSYEIQIYSTILKIVQKNYLVFSEVLQNLQPTYLTQKNNYFGHRLIKLTVILLVVQQSFYDALLIYQKFTLDFNDIALQHYQKNIQFFNYIGYQLCQNFKVYKEMTTYFDSSAAKSLKISDLWTISLPIPIATLFDINFFWNSKKEKTPHKAMKNVSAAQIQLQESKERLKQESLQASKQEAKTNPYQPLKPKCKEEEPILSEADKMESILNHLYENQRPVSSSNITDLFKPKTVKPQQQQQNGSYLISEPS